MSGSLYGIRVIGIGTLIAAPFAGRVKAEFGTEVIKIASLGGDPLRTWRKLHEGTSLMVVSAVAQQEVAGARS